MGTKDEKADVPLGPITQEQLRKSAHNLSQIAFAFQNYAGVNINQTPTNKRTRAGKALLSRRVQILSFIEHVELHERFKLDEPWDSENNKKLIEMIPDMYAPIRGKAAKGQTFYQTFAGKHGWMKPGARMPGSFGRRNQQYVPRR